MARGHGKVGALEIRLLASALEEVAKQVEYIDMAVARLERPDDYETEDQ